MKILKVKQNKKMFFNERKKRVKMERLYYELMNSRRKKYSVEDVIIVFMCGIVSGISGYLIFLYIIGGI